MNLRPAIQTFSIYLEEGRAPVLEALRAAVTINQQESERNYHTTQNLQTTMFFLMIASLLLVGSVILKPLVDKLKDSMAKLKNEKDFTNNILNTAQAFIIGLNSTGKIVLFNSFAEENTGWMEEEVVGEDFFEQFISPDERRSMREVFQESMDNTESPEKEFESKLTIRSDEQLEIIWHTTNIHDPETKQVVLFLATGIDITKRKLAEGRLQTALSELETLSGRLQDEIALAAILQQVLLPKPEFHLPGMQGKATLITSSEVGGDYYDYYQTSAQQSVLFIGDVSGHGVAAGTMVSAAKAGVAPLIKEGIIRPSQILRSLNATIHATAHESLLMTMACLSFDAIDGKLIFANAGHVLPFVYRLQHRKWEMLEAYGLPLGQNVDFDYGSAEMQTELGVGDKLFLFTDGLVEEDSPRGEAYGFERLEELLNQHKDSDLEVLPERILEALRDYCGRDTFTDDVTFAVIEHTDRVQQAVSTTFDAVDIVSISEATYRNGENPVPRASRQMITFLADGDFSDLLQRFTHDGIRRVLPTKDPFYRRLGWNHLLNQHREQADDDLYELCPAVSRQQQFQLTHSDDKPFIIEECQAWLTERDGLSTDPIDSLIVTLDEMIENALYGAPRDGKNNQLYKKGEIRQLELNEQITIDVALGEGVLGLMVTDTWGTFTPSIFLKYLEQTLAEGIEAGVGGGGMYMMWFLSNYLQVRVYPHLRTQVTALWDLSRPLEPELNSGFQFLYHSEYNEMMSSDSPRHAFG